MRTDVGHDGKKAWELLSPRSGVFLEARKVLGVLRRLDRAGHSPGAIVAARVPSERPLEVAKVASETPVAAAPKAAELPRSATTSCAGGGASKKGIGNVLDFSLRRRQF